VTRSVTVIIDLTGIRDRTGPARLLDMVEGRSKQRFQVTGFKTATAEEPQNPEPIMGRTLLRRRRSGRSGVG
jgi:hypothetical protein